MLFLLPLQKIIYFMISFEEAYRIVSTVEVKHEVQRIAFTDAVGYVLAEDVFSDMNMPPFDKSAMDGYACRREDLTLPMKEIEIISAGVVPEKKIEPGTCSRIMTGAMIPEGADIVIKVEDTSQLDDMVSFTAEKSADNICKLGEDIQNGDLVLSKGTMLHPQQIAVLASVGAVKPKVFSKPVVAVISTGNELVEPIRKPDKGQIRNSNASQLLTQIKQIGAEAKYIGIALDTPEDTREKINQAIKVAQVIILTGGVSMGDFDYVPQILIENNVTVGFKSIAVQPGRPTVFAYNKRNFFYGLPGNPVSSFVQFELLVKPLLARIAGFQYSPCVLSGTLAKEYSRRNIKRKSFVPVHIGKDHSVTPVEYHGSAHIHSYVNANAIMTVEVGVATMNKGEKVNVRQI